MKTIFEYPSAILNRKVSAHDLPFLTTHQLNLLYHEVQDHLDELKQAEYKKRLNGEVVSNGFLKLQRLTETFFRKVRLANKVASQKGKTTADLKAIEDKRKKTELMQTRKHKAAEKRRRITLSLLNQRFGHEVVNEIAEEVDRIMRTEFSHMLDDQAYAVPKQSRVINLTQVNSR